MLNASINLAGLCADCEIPFLFTSSDLVFNGLKAPYREEDPVCPINRYGEQKVQAEKGILQRYPEAAVCRMVLMFGPACPASESFIQPMIKAMRAGEEVKLFVDEFRNPVSAATAVQGLLIALQKAGGIIHLGGIERISRYEFGRLAANIFGIPQARLISCMQKDIVMAAPRAPDVTLDSSKAYALGFSPMSLREELKRLTTQ